MSKKELISSNLGSILNSASKSLSGSSSTDSRSTPPEGYCLGEEERNIGIKVPESFKKSVKVYASKKGISLKDLLMAALTEYMTKNL